MNRKITVGLICMMATSLFCKIDAQNYQTLNVTSGYNYDLIANGPGTAGSSTTESVDGSSPTTGFVFMSADFVNGTGATPASGLPSLGLINSANTSGLSFQLAPYSSNNSLRLANANDAGTLSFGTTPKASKVYMLATTGSGSSTATILVNFSDGTSQSFTNITVNDWYGGSSFAIKGIGRANRATDNIENNVNDPRLYEIPLSISPSNQTKNISSITVTKTSSGASILCVFGFSYAVPSSCITPDNVTLSNLTSNSATVSWLAVPGASTYEIYRGTTSTAPANTATPTLTGLTGTSTNMTSLSPSTTYYVWVRSNCGGGSTSNWSQVPAMFTTPCNPVNVPYLEDFNGNYADIPPCTYKEWTSGFGLIMATGFGGAMPQITSPGLILQSIQNNSNGWFYTNGINLQAGTTYSLSFDGIALAGPRSFKVAYGTSPVAASMMNILNDNPNFAATSMTPTSYTFTPPSTGVYYFGFNDYSPTGEGPALFLDNISVKSAVLATAETNISRDVSIYPNPAADYITVQSKQKIAGVEIFDVSGRKILSSDKTDRINLSSLLKGTYILNVKKADGTSSTHKFIKK
ncbi:Por secretion system C-terminal sorting domain-containing protein [Chryseobacterium sp. RU37D]|uniref:T9SS type A sorting domain-containing protein n=1 Tax=Chryseobacterium sp. RU37D TaxID=1907397 RepID=UPI000953A8B1|nr:T9SS type A sorting domain-containing protein [Chryseobacterium sp. RU37D]SIQ02192.1 Por secretion system C-terminal sorting domain-containing protein [Chryseobacterium sp. RU37D]